MGMGRGGREPIRSVDGSFGWVSDGFIDPTKSAALHGKRRFARGREILRAMAEENVARVREAFAAFERGDKDAWRELNHEDAEVVPIGDWPEAQIRGHEAVWDFLVAADEPWEPGRYESWMR
jgi:hypothetical protein